MPDTPIKLELGDCFLDSIEGYGGEITFKLRAGRKNKAAHYVRYELRLKVCRHGIKQILTGLRDMHARDRERINRELARIDREANTLLTRPA